MKQKQHGGNRPGAGRKKGKPTKTLSYRVPADKAKVIDKKIRIIVAEEKSSCQD